MTRQQVGRDAAHEVAQGLVEFALMLPLLVLIFAGLADLGRAYHAYISLSNAALAAARYGESYPANTSGMTARANTAVSGTDVTIAQVNVSYPSGNAPGNPLRVEVRGSVNTILGSLLGFSTLPLSYTIEMVIL